MRFEAVVGANPKWNGQMLPYQSVLSTCLFKTTRCPIISSTAKITVDSDQEHIVTLFNNIIYTVVGQVEDSNLGIQLLDVSPHQYIVGDNIVYAVNKL